MSKGRTFVGTSGYSYPEWKPAFYPEKLAASKFLDFYAQRLSTVEINNTFYRFPAANLLEGWRDGTPNGFRFAVKANQKITHHARLNDVEELTRDFIERCGLLGDKLGPILFQLPPNLKRDDDRLGGFLSTLPPKGAYAIEFRHLSWFDDAVFKMLSDAEVALCVSEGEGLKTPRTTTAGFAYARLRKEEYSADDLADWRQWIAGQLKEGRDVYAYLKHDKKGESPEHALRLLTQ